VTAATSTRAREAVAAGRRLLEEEGTAAIIATGLEEAAEAFEVAVDGADEPLPALAAAYRGFALAHPHLYPPHEQRPASPPAPAPWPRGPHRGPVLRVAGSQARARALWAFAHGMVMLELDHRFPPDADLDRAWQAGIAAFQPA
jgi:hypothetical protein